MRLLTRSDFDGLACAVLLVEAGIVSEFKFVHPKDVHDGKVEATSRDVLANIPYIPGCALWFDHHYSEMERVRVRAQFGYKGRSEIAPSCARVVYKYFGGAEKFSRFDETGLMEAVDRSDSGQLTQSDVTHPTGWILLAFIMDPRTGLGRYKGYRISNYRLMENMIDYCRTMTVDQVLCEPDVKERTERYFQQEQAYEEMLKRNITIDENVIVLNLLGEEVVLPGNRFKEHIFFPEQNAAVRILWGVGRKNVVITCGHSIINRTQKTNIGALMMKYGGGGHTSVGACQVPVSRWKVVKDEIIRALKETKTN